MTERGKAVDMYKNNDYFQDYTTPPQIPCKKHPYNSSLVGVCAYCLKERLVNLVCSDCGEQRLSSCYCSSEATSNRNSCTVDVGSVGRISILLENDERISSNPNNNKLKSGNYSGEKQEELLGFLLKRSSSSCVEIKRKGGFWRIGRLFRKKKEKGVSNCERKSVCGGGSVGGFEEKNGDLWVVDYMGVSRSRSLCSFRGGGFFGSEDGSTFSGARSSISAARSSGFNGGLLFDPDRKSGFSETEPRRSGFECDKKDSFGVEHGKIENCNTRRVFSLKEGNFSAVDDSGFIDLKFDFPSSEPKPELQLPAVKMGALSDSKSAFGSMRNGDLGCQDQSGGHLVDGFLPHGGSCRITVGERGIKRSRKSFKSWRWIFRHHIPSPKKKAEDPTVKNYVS